MNAQSSTRTRRALLGVASTAIGLLVIGYLLGQVPPKPRNLGGELHGFVSTSITTNRDAPQWIRLPNIQVRARNTATKALSAPIATNVHGHFNTPRLATGTYQLCVQGAGYVSNCNAQIFKVESENIVLNFDVPITPQAGAVHGRVLLQDGPTRPCFAERQAFDTLVTGKVWLENSAGKTIAGPVTANSAAQYVIPKIPGAASYQIKASCESGQGARSVALTKADLTNTTSFDLTIANHVPVLASLKPTIGGVLARRTDPGATVQVTADATDPDGDTLHYKWISDTPGFTTVDAPSVTWNLPKISAVNVISVQITDGKGGYVFRSISLQSGPNLIEFNGVVRDRASGAVIAGAEITLIGGGVTRQATTSAQGYFSLAVPDNSRYVMNVNRAGYALVSRIFFASATGLDVLLDAAQVSTLDIDRGGTLIYERKNTVSVRIAPGTLVDAGGKRATGSIRGYAFAYDLDQSDPIPGDLSAKSLGGQDVRLESYGSIHVVFTDMSGNKLQLSPGATADVSFSLQPAAVAAAPHAIPLLSYNEATGFWIEEGQLQLNGGRYEGQVHHFSAFNADTVFTNTSAFSLMSPITTPLRSPSCCISTTRRRAARGTTITRSPSPTTCWNACRPTQW